MQVNKNDRADIRLQDLDSHSHDTKHQSPNHSYPDARSPPSVQQHNRSLGSESDDDDTDSTIHFAPGQRSSMDDFKNRDDLEDKNLNLNKDTLTASHYNDRDLPWPKRQEFQRLQDTAFPRSTVPLDDTKMSRKERVIAYLYRRFSSRIVRRVLKCTLAYFIATLFSLIHPLARAMGQAPYLACTGTLFSHPGRTIGAQIDATVTSSIGTCLGIIYGLGILAATVAYNTHHPDSISVGGAITALLFLLGVFVAQLIRQAYTKLYFFTSQFMVVLLFSLTHGLGYTSVPMTLTFEWGIPLVVGAFISLIVNVLIWPESAVDGLGRALASTMMGSRELLDIITKQFFLDPHTESVPDETIDALAVRIRQDVTKVNTAYQEAKYEISYTYIKPSELGEIRKALDRLTRHLNILGGSLKSERALFGKEEELADGMSTDEEDNSCRSPERQRTHYAGLRGTSASRSMSDIRSQAFGAAMDYAQTGRYSSPRLPSYISTHRAPTEEPQDTDTEEHVSRPIQSYLSLTSLGLKRPTALPRKSSRQIEYGDRSLLATYIENLRDPLMQLSLECLAVLDCVRESICAELDVDDEADMTVRKTWSAYFCHLFKLPKKQKRSSQSHRHGKQACDCAYRLNKIIEQFDQAEKKRMHALYEFNFSQSSYQSLDLGVREELFLVFFFIFSLREVANELVIITNSMDKIRQTAQTTASGKRRKHLYMPQFSQKWWRKWAQINNHQTIRDKGGYTHGQLQECLHEHGRPREPSVDEEYRLTRMQTNQSLTRTRTRGRSSARRLSTNHILRRRSSSRTRRSNSLHRRNTDILDEIHSDIYPAAPTAFMDIENRENEPKAPFLLRLRYKVWQWLQTLNTYEFRFNLKMTLAMGILTLPAFLPSSADWFHNIRGAWAGLSVIACMNPTSGGTLEAGLWRLSGTLMGGFAAWFVLAVGGLNPYVIAGIAVVLAIPFFYIHLATSYNKVGIITLISYMIIALNRYAAPVPGESISATVWKRTGTLVVGVIVALVLNWLIWPFIARDATREFVSAVIGDLGDYYTYLMGTFLYHDERVPPTQLDIVQSQKMENGIQKSITASSVLLQLTDHEPRLKGPFPKEFYREMIVCTRNMLDRLMSMRIALVKMVPAVKEEVCLQAHSVYRHDMVAAMLLHFYTLSTSLKSKVPLPIFMPSARAARLRFLQSRREDAQSRNLFKYRNITWFAMACCTEEVIEELENLNELVGYIVGESRFAEKVQTMGWS
ncbi:Fusaric acid resistance protein-like-domain-containing protein [Radiomyces spectabilis]|uniref:Fusaric acid resistance protein-like-domain-containing protein n=1 Tax=Radiomyces spectabilis TaxID=64574 RepID=UPI00221E9B1D|nr:Fusaric acid resistance protein-like-domain-containing protein [Radiomyces spectabilis]KAI8391655.1 Fusaric acid resistance protein-like-domain-containing protein [Radiomyces spectabilis]